MLALQVINTILLSALITILLTEKYLKVKKTLKDTEIPASSELTHQEDIETLMIKAEEDAEQEKLLKEAEEALQLRAYGMNTAISNTITEIMEGKIKE